MERVLIILSPYILAVLMINHVFVYTPTAQSYSSFRVAIQYQWHSNYNLKTYLKLHFIEETNTLYSFLSDEIKSYLASLSQEQALIKED